MIRHYDDIGLLKPEYIDKSNGYRYYTSAQLPRLHQILSLKEIGFTLEEIKLVLERFSEEKLLMKKKSDLMLEIAELGKKITSIESYLTRDTKTHDYHIITKPLPSVIVTSMHIRMKNYQDLFYNMPGEGLEMEKAGYEWLEPEYCTTIYYDEDYKESDIDAATEMKKDQGDVKFKVLPAVDMAAGILHKGPYETLPESYSAIVNFIEESDYEIIGHQRESYIDGIWNKEIQDKCLTEIQFPIRETKNAQVNVFSFS